MSRKHTVSNARIDTRIDRGLKTNIKIKMNQNMQPSIILNARMWGRHHLMFTSGFNPGIDQLSGDQIAE